MRHKINLYGDGVRLWICDLPIPLFQEMNKTRNDADWELVLFDLDFLSCFGYSHWSELSSLKEIIGLKISNKGIVEIKKVNKKLARFYSSELVEQDVLFPLFKLNEVIIPKQKQETNRLLILEFETGMTHSFITEIEKLRMEDLIFEVQKIDSELYMTGLYCQNVRLKSENSDTVVRGIRVIESTTIA